MTDVAAVGSSMWRVEQPQEVTLATRDGHVFLFNDGSSPIDDPSNPPKLPLSFIRAPDRPDWTPDIELGFHLLETGSL